MRARLPWHRTITDEEIAESKKKLRLVKARKGEVDAITRRADDIIRRNHLGENIHRALGGNP